VRIAGSFAFEISGKCTVMNSSGSRSVFSGKQLTSAAAPKGRAKSRLGKKLILVPLDPEMHLKLRHRALETRVHTEGQRQTQAAGHLNFAGSGLHDSSNAGAGADLRSRPSIGTLCLPSRAKRPKAAFFPLESQGKLRTSDCGWIEADRQST